MCAKKTSSPETGDPAVTPSDLPFEKALETLEQRVADMESGHLTLEAMLKAFEEGQQLVRYCQKKLNEVERRIELLSRDADGRETLTPFPEDAPGDQPDSP